MSTGKLILIVWMSAIVVSCTGESKTTESPHFGGSITEPYKIDRPLTFHTDVRPLVEARCATCHVEGGSGPFALTSYDDVIAHKEAVRSSVAARRMPPFPGLTSCNEYVNDWSLTDEQRSVITSWIDQGAPEGDATNPGVALPPILESLSRKDFSLTMAEPYKPKQNSDDYRCFVLDWPQSALNYVTGIGIEPSNIAAVHHVIVYAVHPSAVSTVIALDQADPGYGYTCFGGPGVLGRESSMLSIWVPGVGAGDFPLDTGIPVVPGTKIVMQMHYNTIDYGSALHGKGEPDQTQAHFKVNPSVAKPAALTWIANPQWIIEPQTMSIPAGASSVIHSFKMDPTLYTEDKSVELHRAALHQHVKGTRSKLSLIRKNTNEQCIVDIPRWDFDWQLMYELKNTLTINPGDFIQIQCEWNNSGIDAIDRTWGEGTLDEMCLGAVYITH